MKVWLDDIRTPPDSTWTWCKHPDDAAVLLMQKNVSIISLDHDLGEGVETGYDLISWMEQYYFSLPRVPTPEIRIHTSNPVGRERMEVVANIIRSWNHT